MAQMVVVIGGGPLSPRALDALQGGPGDGRVVIAADSGLDHAVAAGIRPTHLVGDLDSISASGRMWAYAHELDIDEHPVAKDLTDTELALATAVAALDAADAAGESGDGGDTRTELLLLGGFDPADLRLDHFLGTLLALGHPALARFHTVHAIIGVTEVFTVHPGHTVHPPLETGQTFSLLALHGPCCGVSVRDAAWELDAAELASTEARGLSNIAKEQLMITVTSGVLTVVVP